MGYDGLRGDPDSYIVFMPPRAIRGVSPFALLRILVDME